MTSTNDKPRNCSICDNGDEEDLLLITKALLETFQELLHWSPEGSFFLSNFSEISSKLKEMLRMINFKKLLDVIVGEKHQINQKCKHKPFEEYFLGLI